MKSFIEEFFKKEIKLNDVSNNKNGKRLEILCELIINKLIQDNDLQGVEVKRNVKINLVNGEFVRNTDVDLLVYKDNKPVLMVESKSYTGSRWIAEVNSEARFYKKYGQTIDAQSLKNIPFLLFSNRNADGKKGLSRKFYESTEEWTIDQFTVLCNGQRDSKQTDLDHFTQQGLNEDEVNKLESFLTQTLS